MGDGQVERRRAAVLAADVAGFDQHVREDEAGARAALGSHLEHIFAPRIAHHRGRIVVQESDSLLAEFASVVEAVSCAVDLQGAMARRHQTAPGAPRLDFRIGVNLGEVIGDGAGVHGDGVILAAQLAAQAEPGGVCISETAFTKVAAKLDLSIRALGRRALDDVAAPTRVFAVEMDGRAAKLITPTVIAAAAGAVTPATGRGSGRRTIAATIIAALLVAGLGAGWLLYQPAAPAPERAPEMAQRRSLVVLPLENLDADQTRDYVADGLRLCENARSSPLASHSFLPTDQTFNQLDVRDAK